MPYPALVCLYAPSDVTYPEIQPIYLVFRHQFGNEQRETEVRTREIQGLCETDTSHNASSVNDVGS